MVETPKLSSLASELIRFVIVSALVFGGVISFALFFLGELDPYKAVGVGFSIALVWVVFNIVWVKGKLEDMFSRLSYVIDILEEREKVKEKAVVPIPIHEEVVGIVNGIKELIDSFEGRYEKVIKDLEDQIENISENTYKLLDALEQLEHGNIDVEFPSGLDPIGAVGQAMQHAWDIYADKLKNIKRLGRQCKAEMVAISLILKKEGDTIDIQRLREGIDRVISIEEEIEKELRFIKDTNKEGK